jgi:hypothetical protein
MVRLMTSLADHSVVKLELTAPKRSTEVYRLFGGIPRETLSGQIIEWWPHQGIYLIWDTTGRSLTRDP